MSHQPVKNIHVLMSFSKGIEIVVQRTKIINGNMIVIIYTWFHHCIENVLFKAVYFVTSASCLTQQRGLERPTTA